MHQMLLCHKARPALSLATRVGLVAALGGIGAASGTPPTPRTVWTWHNNNARTGANLHETALTPDKVRGNLRKLLSYRVAGHVYAQPLYLSGVVVVGHGRRNVLFVATQHNMVYAFDAEAPAGSDPAPLWERNLSIQGIPSDIHAEAVPTEDYDIVEVGKDPLLYLDIYKEIGITGTPVIDTKSGTLYVVAATKERRGNGKPQYVQRLHALDVRSGDERAKLHSPQEINGRVKGTGDGPKEREGKDTYVRFLAQQHLQRCALLLANGWVYVAFAAHGDLVQANDLSEPGYHGWVFGYCVGDLQQAPIVWNVTPNGTTQDRKQPAGAGIWMSGAAPAADRDGAIFLSTGNGEFKPECGSYGDSILRLGLTPPGAGSAAALAVEDYFTPANQERLTREDWDVGSSGVLLLPDSVGTTEHPHLLVCGSKVGVMYLVDRAAGRMGKWNRPPEPDSCLQVVDVRQRKPEDDTDFGHIHGAPIYWQSGKEPLVYVWAEESPLKAYPLAGGRLDERRMARSKVSAEWMSMPGGFLSISASGNQVDTGIVWGCVPQSGDANQNLVPGVLYAFNATPVRSPDAPAQLEELWNSNNRAGDAVGTFAKFCPPTVVAGRVYVATFDCKVHVYGLP